MIFNIYVLRTVAALLTSLIHCEARTHQLVLGWVRSMC